MKKLFMIFGLFAVVLCFPVKSYAITRYIINNGKVYYQRLKYRDEMTDADAPTFKNLDYFYAKDKNNVYYNNKKLSKADSKTFEAFQNYGKDRNNVYYREILVKDADPQTFRENKTWQNTKDGIEYMAEDKNNYYTGEEIVKEK